MCGSCAYGQTIEGFRQAEKVVICSFNRTMKIDWPVAKCSAYHKEGGPMLDKMKDIAWIITPQKRGKVGFSVQTPEKFKEENPHEDPTEL